MYTGAFAHSGYCSNHLQSWIYKGILGFCIGSIFLLIGVIFQLCVLRSKLLPMLEDDENQKLTDAYYFYVDTDFEQFPALIFKEHNRWLACKAEHFYESDKLNHWFIPPIDRKRYYTYLEINNRYVFFPNCNYHSLLDIYENNPTYIEFILEDKIGKGAYICLKYQAYEELLKIRHNNKRHSQMTETKETN